MIANLSTHIGPKSEWIEIQGWDWEVEAESSLMSNFNETQSLNSLLHSQPPAER